MFIENCWDPNQIVRCSLDLSVAMKLDSIHDRDFMTICAVQVSETTQLVSVNDRIYGAKQSVSCAAKDKELSL